MKNKAKQKRIIFVSSVFFVTLVALFFVVQNFRENIVFFYSPAEFRTEFFDDGMVNAKSQKKLSSVIRIGGLVVAGSVKKIDALTTEFLVTDYKKQLKIKHVGLLPDLFRDNQGVVAKGKFDVENEQFLSRELLIKHDENYMPPEVAKSIEEKHHQQ